MEVRQAFAINKIVMKLFSFVDIEYILNKSCRYLGNRSLIFEGFKPVMESSKTHVSWIRPGVNKAAHFINHSKAGCIICNQETYDMYTGSLDDILFVISNNPLHSFVKVLNHFEDMSKESETAMIHPTAIVHADCQLGKGVRVGAYSILEACTIGDDTVIENNVKIFSNVVIGNKCLVREYCTIGGAGFGIGKDDEGQNFHVPHIGRAIIGNNVMIFPFSNVDRGTLGDTVVEDNVMIDHYCHISHNTFTGRNTIITAGTILGGGCKVMNDCFLGLNCVVREKIEIGSFVTIAMGAIITKNIPDNATWIGNPAMEIDTFIKQRDFLKKNA